ncbi:MAG TPA: glucoamylase family protein [Gemmatimonadaceae bacterium]|nr:glucoamylase family protein [Gemmatimonadaceae bacterium]
MIALLRADGTSARRRARMLAGAFAVASGTLVACRPVTAPASGAAAPFVPSASQAAFLDTVQRRTFDWFWETTNAANGLVPDRWPTRSFSSVAAVGFGLTSYLVGVERGWITRDQARERVLTTLRFFWTAPQGSGATDVTGHRGFFYHFLDMERGVRFKTVELSTIDTGLLLMGVLSARQYFDRAESGDSTVRALADSIYFRVDWPWARNGAPSLSMGWHPERGFIASRWIGYNEAMLLYALALGSPTHPITPEAWAAWSAGYKWDRFHGQEYVMFAPLFGHQYSHVWLDFRGIQDAYTRARGIDYFENSRRATLAHRAYATANPGGWRGYADSVWGLTASDGPLDSTFVLAGRQRRFHTYWARGTGTDEINDDGTIAPTAAGGSVPFAPEVAIPALSAMRRQYGDALFGRYGFVDAFNPSLTDGALRVSQGRIHAGVGWFDTDYLGIDQGPILLMIENQRSQFVWRLMRGNPHLTRGLCRAGFSGGWLAGKCV